MSKVVAFVLAVIVVALLGPLAIALYVPTLGRSWCLFKRLCDYLYERGLLT